MEKTITPNPFRKTWMLLLLVFLTAQLNAQITVEASNISIKEILKIIETKSDYRFFYNEGLKGLEKVSSLNVKNASLEKTMSILLTNTDINYKLEKNNLVVLIAKVKVIPKDGKKISGVVTDKKGESIIGATVMVKGDKTGTITDMNGNFSLDNISDQSTLTVSYIGYASMEVRVGSQKTLMIQLEEDAKDLEELIVIGYGVVKKRDLTGAVSSVKASDMNIVTSSSIGSALKGKAAGLSIRQNSAQPGGGLDILIRGAGSVNANNEPLYIVDGFPIAALNPLGSTDLRLDPGTQSVLNFVNPNDIASVEVLKDASSTAIYGARAANGVVLITTKRGISGKTIVNYTTSTAIQKHTNIFDVYSLKEWMNAKNNSSWDMWMWENQVIPYGGRTLEQAVSSPKNGVAYDLPYDDNEISNAGKGTDWVGLVTRDGSIQQHNISVQGGTDQTKYMISLNYYDNKGIIKNSEMKRYTGKINLDQNIN